MNRILVSNGNPLEEVVGFCRAVRVGPYISVGGTAPVDAEGRTVGVGDPDSQARQCLEIIRPAMEAAGARLQDVVRTRMHAAHFPSDADAYYRIKDPYMDAIYRGAKL